ncbi:S9 family peptidase [Halovenus rubra]|uniref:S9 family peptidase n=2 Tax=Halovenus rubra TaxID=869890 RepID=A0ACC7E524_9EURY|nr:S9 family peptidase [Halovenus rubra]
MQPFDTAVYNLERYLTIRQAYAASLSPDGTLAFLLDTTGVPQIWTMDEPGSWPVQRTFYDEPVSFCSYSPERPELIFGMDEGGNERMQLFRLDGDGHITPLTDMPDAKHYWGGWRSDGEQFAFASNRRDESVFDVYVQDRDGTGNDAERVFEGDGWFTVGGWSPDGDELILVESHSGFDQDVSVLDLDTGEVRHLNPDDDEVRYRSPQWAPDGEALYVATDRGADTMYLARMDAETGNLETVRDGGDWNVGGVALDEDSGLLAYSRNVDGYTDLTLGELTGETEISELPMPEMPGNVAGGISFGPDGNRLAISSTGRSLNTNISVVDVQALREADSDEILGGDGAADTLLDESVTRWTHASTAGIPLESFVEPDLVHYESFDGREIPAFFSLPENVPEGGAPVIVDIHGGPESQRRPSFAGLTQYFLSRGYAVFEPNVRGSTGYGRSYTHLDDVENRMDSVRDIEAALDWLEGHDAVDPDRFVAKGGSYGGFMVLASVTEFPERWAAGVDIVGIANFVTFLENTGPWRRKLREAEYGSLEEDRGFLEDISPLNNIENIEAPLFVLHGENDPRVPVGEAEQIVEGAREQGVPVEKRIFEDEGHGISKLENRIEAYSQIVEFLDEHV